MSRRTVWMVCATKDYSVGKETGMLRLKRIAWFTLFLGALAASTGSTQAKDIGGAISSTLTITEDSRLVADVTCTVTSAPCIAVGATSVKLDLNGFTMTGQADPQTGCSGVSFPNEVGIDVNAQSDAVVVGPGVVERFRSHAIRLLSSTGVKVTGTTASTNCSSGIIVQGGSLNEVESNTSIRNGSLNAPCGGI